MGLKENRLVKVVQEENIPAHQSYAQENFGIKISFDIDFDQWKTNYEAVLNLNGYVLDQAMQALYRIARDDMGKEAIAESVQQIRVRRVEAAADKTIELGEGFLSLIVAPDHGWDGVFGHGEIAEYLTDNL